MDSSSQWITPEPLTPQQQVTPESLDAEIERNEDLISPLDDAIVEDGIEDTNELRAWRATEFSAERIEHFYDHLFHITPPEITKQVVIQITIAWVRAGMP
jgi:hypothetical protein